jgi:molybdopterin molybdotransferase
MVSYERALQIILNDVRQMGTERIGFEDALFRMLAEDIFSDIDMPPFDKSAMDGYACRREDLDKELEVTETIAAGEQAKNALSPGQCVKIMTGAMVPPGADTVIMVEHTEEARPGYIRFTGSSTPANIAYLAEDVRNGDLIWEKGMQILPQHVAVFAAVGCTNPLVAKQVRVAILSTGDELVEPHDYPALGKIRNSNGSQLVAQVKAAHCSPNYMGIVPDSKAATRKAIGTALAENDVVILSGGVSMGDFDFVPAIMRELGVEILFQKVAIKPGRPTVFGRTDTSYIFGLPGNPVSSFINFEVMVKPLLYQMMGSKLEPMELSLPLGFDFSRKKADRPEFIPVNFDKNGYVASLPYHGSAHIHAVCLANALMYVPQDVFTIREGEKVLIRPLIF